MNLQEIKKTYLEWATGFLKSRFDLKPESFDKNSNGIYSYEFAAECLWEYIKSTFDKLAELEDKLESGSRLKLPCKVGDMIYVPWVWKGTDGIMTSTVSEICIFEQFIQIACFDLETDDFEFERQLNFGMFYDYDFGKIWFTDIKAAEARLKELQEGK